MTSRIASHSHFEDRRRAPYAAPDVKEAPSPTVVVAKVVLGAILVLIGLTVVAVAPMSIAVLLGIAGLSGLLALVGRQRYAGRPARRATAVWRRSATDAPRTGAPAGRVRYLLDASFPASIDEKSFSATPTSAPLVSTSTMKRSPTNAVSCADLPDAFHFSCTR